MSKKITSFESLSTVALHGRACYQNSFEKKEDYLRNARDGFDEKASILHISPPTWLIFARSYDANMFLFFLQTSSRFQGDCKQQLQLKYKCNCKVITLVIGLNPGLRRYGSIFKIKLRRNLRIRSVIFYNFARFYINLLYLLLLYYYLCFPMISTKE